MLCHRIVTLIDSVSFVNIIHGDSNEPLIYMWDDAFYSIMLPLTIMHQLHTKFYAHMMQ